ncbi:MAG TPA: hypothetical protein PLF61_05075 [Candidatus Goldiibacteriota bacterium]|nr:hypothetical protein [Candidatus Goldiibacteriota bacterium]
MKPFECDVCNRKIQAQNAIVRWHFEKSNKIIENIQIVHDAFPCNAKGEGDYFNRQLPLNFVYKNMPEFIYYINRFNPPKKFIKDFVHRIEKDRSYIRRYNVNKKTVQKMIILMEGLE